MKNFFALLVFAALAVSGFYYYQYSEAKKINNELAPNIAAVEKQVLSAREELKALIKYQEVQGNIRNRRTEVEMVQKKDRELEDKLASLQAERRRHMDRNRQAMVGQLLPELTLADGRKLTQARVLKVEDSGLSVSVLGNVVRLGPNDLPKELRQKLVYR